MLSTTETLNDKIEIINICRLVFALFESTVIKVSPARLEFQDNSDSTQNLDDPTIISIELKQIVPYPMVIKLNDQFH